MITPLRNVSVDGVTIVDFDFSRIGTPVEERMLSLLSVSATCRTMVYSHDDVVEQMVEVEVEDFDDEGEVVGTHFEAKPEQVASPVYVGVDPTPESILTGIPWMEGQIVRQAVAPSLPGVEYLLTARVRADNGLIFELHRLVGTAK